jgi:hypothetical protein
MSLHTECPERDRHTGEDRLREAVDFFRALLNSGLPELTARGELDAWNLIACDPQLDPSEIKGVIWIAFNEPQTTAAQPASPPSAVSQMDATAQAEPAQPNVTVLRPAAKDRTGAERQRRFRRKRKVVVTRNDVTTAGIDGAAYTAAIVLAGAAAWFSIRGMVVLFPGAPLAVLVAVVVAMECAKLVAAGWIARRRSTPRLHANRNLTAPRFPSRRVFP